MIEYCLYLPHPDGYVQCEVCGDQRRRLTFRMCSTVGINTVRADQLLGKPLDIPVGTMLHMLIKRLGFVPTKDCTCGKLLREINAWGITGCREHRAEIVTHLKAAYKETSWADFAAASAKAIASGLAFKINPLDPFGSLVDEAIRLAEQSGQGEG